MTDTQSFGPDRPRRGIPTPAEEEAPSLDEAAAETTNVNGFAPIPRRSALTPASPSEAPAVPRRSALTPPSPVEPGQWRAVPKEDGTPGKKPPLPVWLKAVGAGVIVALVGFAAWFGYSMAKVSPASAPSAAASNGAWELKLPVQVQDYVAGEPKDPGNASPDMTVLSANYSDGTNQVVLQLYRPETSVEAYVTAAGIENTAVVGESTCGTLKGPGIPMCVRVVDETAIAVGGLTSQSHEALAALLDEFYAKLSGR